MADLPIPFSGPMVRALLREIEAPGTGKTQTRRGHPPEPRFSPDGCSQPDLGGRPCWWDFWAMDRAETQRFKLPYAVGDRLYVREHWRTLACWDNLAPRNIPLDDEIQFVADDPLSPWDSRFRQGMHMPRWASRLTLTVTDVRVQRLQEISTDDAIAEGVNLPWVAGGTLAMMAQGIAKDGFKSLWNSINGPEAWDANPWVAAYSFSVHGCNIDQVAA